jgi:hypothetical protein
MEPVVVHSWDRESNQEGGANASERQVENELTALSFLDVLDERLPGDKEPLQLINASVFHIGTLQSFEATRSLGCSEVLTEDLQ